MALLDPRNPAFWEQENSLLASTLDELILDILLRGGQAGSDLMPTGFDLLIDWDVFNANAIAFLREYQLDTINGINETTRARVLSEIEQWVREGVHLDRLKERLRPLFTENRADMVAITEVTRIYAQGNMLAWQATGFVGGKRWQTARDERVCPICGPLHGKIVSLSSNFELSPDDVANSAQFRRNMGEASIADRRAAAARLLGNTELGLAPPAHPRCRCWLQPFVSTEAVRFQRLRDLGLLSAFNDAVSAGVIAV